MSVETASGAVGLGAPMPLSQSRHRRRAIAALYAVLVTLALYPVMTSTVPPLVDYANHLARVHVLAELDNNPVLAARYAANWSVIPNLAMDGLLLLLMQFFSVFDAGRLFVAVTLVLPVAGVAALRRVLYGRVGLLPAVSLLFLYNQVFAWGFLSCLFGIGLYLLAFAGWLATGRWHAIARLCVFSVVASGLFFAHIFALGLFGLSVMSYELWRCSRRRPFDVGAAAKRLILAGGQFVLPAALWLNSAVGAGERYTHYGIWNHKIRVLFSPALTHGESVDFEIFLFALFVLVAGVLLRKIRFAPPMRLPLLVLGVAAVLMPNWLLGTWGVDLRLPPVLVFLALAAMAVKFPRPVVAGCAAMALFLFVSKMATTADTWHAFDRQVVELRAAFSDMERGSRFITFHRRRTVPNTDPRIISHVYWNVASLAVIDRDVFFPSLFTDPVKQPLAAAPAYRHIDSAYGRPMAVDQLYEGANPEVADILVDTIDEKGRRRFWAKWPSRFDYLLSFHLVEEENPMPEVLERTHQGSFFTMYRIRRPDGEGNVLPRDEAPR